MYVLRTASFDSIEIGMKNPLASAWPGDVLHCLRERKQGIGSVPAASGREVRDGQQRTDWASWRVDHAEI